MQVNISHTRHTLDELHLLVVHIFSFSVMERRRYYRDFITLFGKGSREFQVPCLEVRSILIEDPDSLSHLNPSDLSRLQECP